MTSPTVFGFLAALTVFFIMMGIVRPQNSIFAADSKESLLQKYDDQLKRAGIVHISASVLLFAYLLLAVVSFVVMFLATGNIIFAFFAMFVAPVMLNFTLDRKARQLQQKLAARLVPFLRKIESQVRVGENPAKAFAIAANEDDLIRWTLRRELRDLELQKSFDEVLEDTLKRMPIRPWIQFVRSMQAFAESGGQLADILAANVSRINSQILLKQRLMGDVAQYRGQQVVILGFALVIPVVLGLTAGDTFGSLFSSPIGIIMLLFSIVLDVIAWQLTNRALKDVERRLEA